MDEVSSPEVSGRAPGHPPGLTREMVRASIPPGWDLVVEEAWCEALRLDVAVTRAGVLEGALDISMDPEHLGPADRDAVAVAVASVRYDSRLTCAGCGRLQVEPQLWESPEDGTGALPFCDECARALNELGGSVGEFLDHQRAAALRLDEEPNTSATSRGALGLSATTTRLALTPDTPRSTPKQSAAHTVAQAPAHPDAAPEERSAREWYTHLYDQMTNDVVGHLAAIESLALLGALWRTGHRTPPVRATLVGAPGTGKTTLLNSLARAMGAPVVTVNVPTLAETNWSGADLSAVMETAFLQAECTSGGQDPERVNAGGVILLDELCSLCYRGTARNAATRDHLIGKARCLLPVLGGEQITLREGTHGRTRSINCGEWLCVGAGVFRGLASSSPTSDEFVRLGLLPELVDRLGVILVLDLPDPAYLAGVLGRSLPGLRQRFRAFGFDLEVAPATVRYLAQAAVTGQSRTATRQTLARLLEAGGRLLVRLLDEGVPEGARVTLAPDDLWLPGGWASGEN